VISIIAFTRLFYRQLKSMPLSASMTFDADYIPNLVISDSQYTSVNVQIQETIACIDFLTCRIYELKNTDLICFENVFLSTLI
jgi:hypothetical protein